MPEVDEAVALAKGGITVATYGDMLHVPGTSASLSDVRSSGADVRVVYSAAEAAETRRWRCTNRSSTTTPRTC